MAYMYSFLYVICCCTIVISPLFNPMFYTLNSTHCFKFAINSHFTLLRVMLNMSLHSNRLNLKPQLYRLYKIPLFSILTFFSLFSCHNGQSSNSLWAIGWCQGPYLNLNVSKFVCSCLHRTSEPGLRAHTEMRIGQYMPRKQHPRISSKCLVKDCMTMP